MAGGWYVLWRVCGWRVWAGAWAWVACFAVVLRLWGAASGCRLCRRVDVAAACACPARSVGAVVSWLRAGSRFFCCVFACFLIALLLLALLLLRLPPALVFWVSVLFPCVAFPRVWGVCQILESSGVQAGVARTPNALQLMDEKVSVRSSRL